MKWLDESLYFNSLKEKSGVDIDRSEDGYAWFITRGTELCDVSDAICKLYSNSLCDVSTNYSDVLASKPNVCILHKLTYPTKKGGEFKLEEVMKYQHEE